MKKAIIIGATSGTGKGLARLLAANHYQVGITGRRANLLSELKNENANSCFVSSFDVADTTKTVEKLEALTAELGGLDLLVICSGTEDINEGLDFEIERGTINTNALGFTCIADWAFNYFERQNSDI